MTGKKTLYVCPDCDQWAAYGEDIRHPSTCSTISDPVPVEYEPRAQVVEEIVEWLREIARVPRRDTVTSVTIEGIADHLSARFGTGEKP